MHPLKPDQIEVLDSALSRLQIAYNQFNVKPCHFTGIPDDLSSLDYIPYELPMADEFAAGSVAFALAWGHVLRTSFGFSWVATDHCVGPKGFALLHEDPSVLIFPYFRLLEITESFGPQDSPAESLWFDVIRHLDRGSYVPDGWHPVFDAVQCPEKLGCPESTTKACKDLIDRVPEFYRKMSTYPYLWASNKQWDELSNYASQWVADHRLFNR